MPEIPRLSTRAWCAVLVCLATVAAGCSTTSWDTTEANSQTATTVKEYTRDEAGVRESLVDHLSTVGDNLNEWAAPKDQAECAATKAIERFGVDRLLALGYEPTDGKLALPYTEDEFASMLNILVNCIDFQEGFLSMLSSYQKLDVESSQCLSAGLERLGATRDLAEGLLRGVEADPFGNETRLAQNVTRTMIQCLDNEDLVPVIEQPDFPQDVGVTTTSAPAGTTTTTAPRLGFEPTTTTSP